MSILIYKEHWDSLYLGEAVEEDTGDITFSFPDGYDGTLRLGKSSVRVTGGIARVKLSDAPDGIYAPRLTTAHGDYRLSRLSFSCGVVTPAPPTLSELARSESDIAHLSESVSTLSRRIKALEHAVGESVIF